MQSVSVFVDIIKGANCWSKNADISRNHGLCHGIYVIFGLTLGKV